MSTHCVFTFHVFTFHVFTFHVFTFHPLPICSSGDDWDIIGATSPRWRNWQTHCFEVAASNIVQVQILSWAFNPSHDGFLFCALFRVPRWYFFLIKIPTTESPTMTKHATGTREQWLAARLDLLKAEK